MCGRFAITSPQAIQSAFHLREEIAFPPRYNLAPSQTIPIIKKAEGRGYHLAQVRWGLIPFWAKDPKIAFQTINARAETLAEKPAFREAYRQRRCLIPATGFYEWQRKEAGKQPYFIRPKDRGLFAFAGLWEQWQAPGGEAVESATIITTCANSLVARLHERMPLIVKPEQWGSWLDLVKDPIHDLNFLQPYDPRKILVYPVSRMVNDARHDSAACLKRIDLR